MKVLHVIPSVSLGEGGPSQVIRTMTQGLAERGIDVHVATTDDAGNGQHMDVPLGQPVEQQGVTYWYFRRSTTFYKVSLPMSGWLSRHVAGYDLAHIHALFSYTPTVASYWAARRNVPYIVRPLGVLNRWGVTQGKPLFKRASIALAESRIVRGAARMHYTAQAEQDEAEASLGFSTRGVIVPNPVEGPPEPLDRRTYPGLSGRPVILFLSRVNPKKGLDLLLDAFAQLRQQGSNAALVIAGTGEPAFVETLKQQANRLGIANDTIWTGFLTGDAKWPAYASADVFVLPSYSENFGVAPVEAMAAGVPVVVSDQVGVHPEVTVSGAGVVVPCDAGELARALAQILSNTKAATLMRERGQAYAKKVYSVRAVSDTLYRVYDSVLRERNRSATLP